MRSTDMPSALPSGSPSDTGAVFDTQVVPAAGARRARGVPGLPLGPDPATSSYFVTRERRSLTPADFEWPAVSTADELRDRLRALWAGDPELLALIEPLLSLVRMPEAWGPQGGAVEGSAVPDHIYPMY